MGIARYSRRTLAPRARADRSSPLVFCLPFYLLVAISLETTAQTYKTPLSFPLAAAVRQLLGGVAAPVGKAGSATRL